MDYDVIDLVATGLRYWCCWYTFYTFTTCEGKTGSDKDERENQDLDKKIILVFVFSIIVKLF